MRRFTTLVRRELGLFFHSFTGYLVITLVALLLGSGFFVMVKGLNNEVIGIPFTEIFYDTHFFWMIIILASPVVTMRVFAQEKNSGTFESLMTAPVGNVQLVMAKFTAVMIFFVVMWLPLPGCLWVIQHFNANSPPIDFGQNISTALGILMLGMLYLSMGCFASSLTRSQIIAAMISLSLGIVIFTLSFLPALSTFQDGIAGTLLKQFSLMEHMSDFVRGVIDTRHIIFYLSVTGMFLFFTVKTVELRQWN